jgi:predicted dehydrogenase
MAVLRAGLIGAGIGSYHAEGYQAAKGVELVAVCDQDAKRAGKIAKPLGATVYTDYPDMLAKAELDLVSVCLPNDLHANAAIACLQAGAHVLCEKPPALNQEQVEEMIEAARTAERHLSWGFNNRFRPEAQRLKRLADEGFFGDIYAATCGWIRNSGIPGWGGWFTVESKAGGGPAIDLGVHMLDLTLWLMGYPEPEEVMGITFQKFGPERQKLGPWGKPAAKGKGVFDVEDMAMALIRFKDGKGVYLEASWAAHIRRERVWSTLMGTKAGASLERVFKQDGVDDSSVDTLELYQDVSGKPQIEPVKLKPDPKMGRVEGVRQFAEAIVRGEAPPVPAEDGLTLMRVITAIYESQTSGISVDDP